MFPCGTYEGQLSLHFFCLVSRQLSLTHAAPFTLPTPCLPLTPTLIPLPSRVTHIPFPPSLSYQPDNTRHKKGNSIHALGCVSRWLCPEWSTLVHEAAWWRTLFMTGMLLLCWFLQGFWCDCVSCLLYSSQPWMLLSLLFADTVMKANCYKNSCHYRTVAVLVTICISDFFFFKQMHCNWWAVLPIQMVISTTYILYNTNHCTNCSWKGRRI